MSFGRELDEQSNSTAEQRMLAVFAALNETCFKVGSIVMCKGFKKVTLGSLSICNVHGSNRFLWITMQCHDYSCVKRGGLQCNYYLSKILYTKHAYF